jgi:hypothetical protein
MESEQQSMAAGEETRMEEGDVAEASHEGRGGESEKEETTVTATDEDTARETEGGQEGEREGATDIGEGADSEREGARETTGEQDENKETSEKECTPPPAPAVDEATLAPGDSDEQATSQIGDEKEGEMEQKMETD